MDATPPHRYATANCTEQRIQLHIPAPRGRAFVQRIRCTPHRSCPVDRASRRRRAVHDALVSSERIAMTVPSSSDSGDREAARERAGRRGRGLRRSDEPSACADAGHPQVSP
ncbi:MAG: hypothetical protein AVDCRST_MAG79-821 [uncultured Thermoleophilia bacterium]|uniref:Uncharacterized protein n=1 Tax=uncultured Thermoleophilia bacterium TaxID=1497501 RepID=A0A6J4TRN2_9ACTN|nr:MAG: hypothetical protein AVDCRST_MAG79-821 [uncultured Thermoleophilia bacterium]